MPTTTPMTAPANGVRLLLAPPAPTARVWHGGCPGGSGRDVYVHSRLPPSY
jgi:hypothetical protein